MSLDWLRGLWTPETDWIQVEVSSFCNASCFYCPHTVLRDVWESRYMSLETYGRLRLAFSKTKLVYLQGWGEPLLHPDFFEMVAMAKNSGCRVGTTTNGSLVNEVTAERIVESGLDLVAFSLAGVDEGNDAIREGTSLEKVFAGIRALRREKEKRDLTTPVIGIAYLLLRSRLDDLERIPSVMGTLGVGQVVISTLDFVPTPRLEEESFLDAPESEMQILQKRLDSLVDLGYDSGVDIHYHLGFHGKRYGECLENATRSLFVGSDGTVAPCVFANLPISAIPTATWPGKRPHHKIVFGSIDEDRLSAIWGRADYVRLRGGFPDGPLHGLCVGCPKLR